MLREERWARVNQILSILDSYAYRTLVWDIYIERMRAAENGRVSDEARIAAALSRAETCLGALEALMADAPWLAGPALTLADLHAAPIFAYGMMAPEGRALVARHGAIREWWEMMARRPRTSVAAALPRAIHADPSKEYLRITPSTLDVCDCSSAR